MLNYDYISGTQALVFKPGTAPSWLPEIYKITRDEFVEKLQDSFIYDFHEAPIPTDPNAVYVYIDFWIDFFKEKSSYRNPNYNEFERFEDTVKLSRSKNREDLLYEFVHCNAD